MPDEKPVITRAEDSNGNIIENLGSTTDSTVKLIGTAAKNQQVQVFDNNIPKGTPPVNASGGWELLLSQLNMARHTFKALALYGTGQSSDPYTVDVMRSEDWRSETVGRIFPVNTPSTVSSGLIVTNLGGTANQTMIFSIAPPTNLLVMWGICRFSWSAQNMAKVTIRLSAVHDPRSTVTFLDSNGTIVGVIPLSAFVEFSAPLGSLINSFIIDLTPEGDKGGYVHYIAWLNAS